MMTFPVKQLALVFVVINIARSVAGDTLRYEIIKLDEEGKARDLIYLRCGQRRSEKCFWVHGLNTTRPSEFDEADVVYGRFYDISRFHLVGRYNEYVENCGLYIKGANEQDAGIWTCSNGTITERVQLEVIASPKTPEVWHKNTQLITIPYYGNINNVPVFSGQEYITPDDDGFYRIRCVSPNGLPKPESMSWTVDERVVEPQPEMEIKRLSNGRFNATSTLAFHPKDMNESCLNDFRTKGIVVTCTVRHKAEVRARTVERLLADSRKLTKAKIVHSDPEVMVIGDVQASLFLFCDVDGRPLPEEFRFLKFDPKSKKEEEVGRNQSIVIWESGTYFCKAIHKLPSPDEKRVKWISSDKVTIESDTDPKRMLKVAKDSKLNLPCQLDRKEDECFWLHNDVIIFSDQPSPKPGYKVHRNRNNGSCNLMIDKVNESDRGSWQCASQKSNKHNRFQVVTVE